MADAASAVSLALRPRGGGGVAVAHRDFPADRPLADVFAWAAEALSAPVAALSLTFPTGAQPARVFRSATDSAVALRAALAARAYSHPPRPPVVVEAAVEAAQPARALSSEEAFARVMDLFSQAAPRPTAPAAAAAASKRAKTEEEAVSPEERARLAEIDETLAKAIEFAPEQFGSVEMLYVPCTVNGHTVAALVDTGAAISLISLEMARRCGIAHLIDQRPMFSGIARGVGEQKMYGRLHMVPVKVQDMFMPFALMVLEKFDHDLLLGLDQLRRFQMTVNLTDNRLHVGETSVRFMSDWETQELRKAIAEADAAREKAKAEEEEEGKKGEREKDPAQAAPPASSPAPPVATTAAAVNEEEEKEGGAKAVAAPGEGVAAGGASESATAAPPPQTTPLPTVAEMDEKIQQIMDFTGLENADDARELLVASGWDIEAAAALFFGEE